jgi:hypothetical protein
VEEGMEHGVEDGGLKTEIRDQTSEVRGKKAVTSIRILVSN